MAIFRGTGGSGSSSDSTIVDAVTAQATIATTKAGEASTSATTATTKASEASTSATTATTKASEASSDAAGADLQRQLCVALRLEAYNSAQEALASANAAETSATTANSSAVQTVAGSNTQVVGVYNNIANVNTVAGVNTDVTTVAGISSDVTTVAADASDIGTVSTNIANVNNVGNNIANVNAVHGNASNINTVAADGTDIGTVATNIANVNTVAGISSNVTTVAGLEAKMDTVIADASDIGAVAGNIGDVTTVAGINSDVDTVAGIAAKVTTVADNISDVQNADTNATNAASSASNASASATSASNSATTATTKATEASNSATAASNSATTATTKASQAAGSATTAGTSASTATTKASEASASATTATTKAGEAASSASAASGSASTAVTKASEASVSAASAATSATNSSNAASTWNNFYNSYLGVADAPPSVDVLGNALVAGALYYDTGAGSNTVGLYVYNGSTWVYSTNYNNVTAPYSLSQDLATNGNDISFGDNAKAKFGASDDLQIYHDNSSNQSYIAEGGLADLLITTNGAGIKLQKNTGENMIKALTDGAVTLYHDNQDKLSTTSTGIDVTGTVTADGFQTDTSNTNYNLLARNSSNVAAYIQNGGTGDVLQARSGNMAAGQGDLHLKVANNGDISFYEDTGTTPKFFWDASAERLGIGTSSPSANLHVSSSGDTIARITSADGNSAFLDLGDASDPDGGRIVYDSGSNLALYTASTERMRIDSSGNVGIGTTSPNVKLHVKNNTGVKLSDSASARHLNITPALLDGTPAIIESTSANGLRLNASGSGAEVELYSNNTERMRIDSSGRVGINTTSPSRKLVIQDTGAQMSLLSANTGSSVLNLGDTDDDNIGRIQYDNQNNKMLFRTNTVDRLTIDSSGNVGIGTTTPAQKLDVSSAGTTRIQVKNTNLTSSGLYIAEDGTGAQINETGAYPLRFNTSGSERMRIDSSGNVGIGTASITDKLTVNGGIKAIQSDSVNTSAIALDFGSDIARVRSTVNGTGTQRPLGFFIGGSEKARIDTSGNLLVGTTDNTLYNNTTGGGANILADGLTTIARQTATVSDTVFVLNDTGAGGSIQEFRKDGTTVGSIGSAFGNRMFVGSGDTAVRFAGDLDTIVPWNGSTNALRDASIDLGEATGRFKDLYLSGTAHIEKVSATRTNGVCGEFNRSNNGHAVQFFHNSVLVGSVSVTGSATSYNTSSDQRLKENIQDADDAGSKIDAIQVRQFDWKSDGSHQDYGVIAQELVEVAPEAVTAGETEDDMMSVDYSKLVPTLIKEIQTLRNRVAQLENN